MYKSFRRLLISYIFTAFVLLLVPGCSSTYVQEQYSSKNEFYNRISDVCSDRTVDINFTDGTETEGENTTVNRDSIHWYNLYKLKGKRQIPVKDLKNIKYTKIRL